MQNTSNYYLKVRKQHLLLSLFLAGFIAILFGFIEGSSFNTEVNSNGNQQDVSSYGLDRPNTCSATDYATQVCTLVEQLRAHHGKVWQNVFGTHGSKKPLLQMYFQNVQGHYAPADQSLRRAPIACFLSTG